MMLKNCQQKEMELHTRRRKKKREVKPASQASYLLQKLPLETWWRTKEVCAGNLGHPTLISTALQ